MVHFLKNEKKNRYVPVDIKRSRRANGFLPVQAGPLCRAEADLCSPSHVRLCFPTCGALASSGSFLSISRIICSYHRPVWAEPVALGETSFKQKKTEHQNETSHYRGRNTSEILLDSDFWDVGAKRGGHLCPSIHLTVCCSITS